MNKEKEEEKKKYNSTVISLAYTKCFRIILSSSINANSNANLSYIKLMVKVSLKSQQKLMNLCTQNEK